MISSSKVSRAGLALLMLGLAACTSAKSPLAERDGATFAIIPEKLEAVAELGRATPDSFGRPRSQRLHFTVCLQSLTTGEAVAKGTSFAIVDVTGTAIKRDATSGGCLKWDEEHAVSPLAPERNVRVERRIRALTNHRGEVSLAYNVKPWLDGAAAVQTASNLEQFTGAIEAAGGLGFTDQYPLPADAVAGAKGVSVTSVGAPDGPVDPAQEKPRFLLGDNHVELSFVSIGREADYSVDQFLNLSMPYVFNYSVRPLITRRTFSGARVSEPMTSGRLRLTLVFFASSRGGYAEDNRYLTSVQVEGDVEPNGVFSGKIVLKYPHAHFASGRQTVLLTLSSPGQNVVDAASFSGALSFIDQQGSMLMLKDERNGETIHANNVRARDAVAARRGKPLAEFLASHDVVQMDATKFKSERISAEELSFALDHDGLDSSAVPNKTKVPLSQRLCRTFLDAGGQTPDFATLARVGAMYADYAAPDDELQYYGRYCETKRLPTEYVDIQQLDFIDELITPVPRNVRMRTYTNQDFGLYVSRDEAKVTSQNVAIGIHAQYPELVGIFGDLSLVFSRILTRSQRSSFAQSQSMAIDMGALEVHARVRSCVLLTGKSKLFPKKPWLICQPEVKPDAWLAEHFFYYSQIFGAGHSPFLDPFDTQTGVKLLVRGRYEMQRISAKLQQPDYARTGFNVLGKLRAAPALSTIDTLGPVDDLTEQAVPGAFLRN